MKMKTGALNRYVILDRAAINEDTRTVSFSFSSEEPVERYFGAEILDHSPKSVRLKRMKTKAPLLLDHNPEKQVGVIEQVEIGDDRRGHVVARFGKSAMAEEAYQDVLDDIKSSVSVGYMIHKMKEEEKGKYRAVDWEPYEVSIVSMPADITVGIGREAEINHETEIEEIAVEEPPQPTEENTDMSDTVDVSAIEQKATADSLKRVKDISALGTQYGKKDLADTAIVAGTSVEDFRTELLAALATKDIPITPPATEEPMIEQRMIYNPGALKAWERHGAKAEEKAYRAGMWAKGVLLGDRNALAKCKDMGIRVMTEGVGTDGGFLIPEEMESAVIDLRAQYGVARRLARMVPMGSASITIPKRSSGTTAYFVGETAATTESDMAWGQIELVAKELSALTRISMSLAEDAIIDLAAWIADEQAYAFAVKEDNCLFIGDGTSTYGGMVGINTLLESAACTAGRYTAATNTDTFSEVIASELAGTMSRCPSYARMGARWVASPTADSLIFGSLMAAGGGNTIQTLSGGLTQSYLGYERVLAEPMPSSTSADLTSKVILLFGNFAQGVVFGERRGITIQVLRERYAEYRQIGILGTERVDINVHGCGDTSTAGPIVCLFGG